ncbi:COMPASS component Swd1p [Monosporozyma servazzii]
MNLLLQDPFSVLKEYPEKLTHTIQNPLVTTSLKYSPQGHYLALGSVNGSVMIFDMDTFRPIHVLGSQCGGAHSRAVHTIEWSNISDDASQQSGRYIVTSGRDWCVRVWDILDPGKPLYQVSFDGPVWGSQWVSLKSVGESNHEESHQSLVATIFEEPYAYYIDPIKNLKLPLQQDFTGNGDSKQEDHGFVLTSTIHPKLNNVVITGSSKGWIEFYRIYKDDSNQASPHFTLLYSDRISGSNIKDIIISQNGDRMAVNCSDRTIRQYSLSYEETTTTFTLDLEHKYQDVINKLQWNAIVFSNKSGDYIVASTHGSSTHELYLWETNSGSLVRVLEGAEEELMDIDWNFHTMSIASNGFETGDVYVWSLVIPPKWSALAPDFEEVEENIDYQEKEDEFDEVDETVEKLKANSTLKNDKDLEPIDLRTREKYDVRGNDLSHDQCPVPIDYERIITLNQRPSS